MRVPDKWSKAPLTGGIAVALVVVWLLITITQQQGWATYTFGFWPGAPELGPRVPIWLQPLTVTLIHSNFFHLLFNTMVLIFCGRRVENLLGTPAFAILYVLGAYAAAGAQYLVNPAVPMPIVGASCAIAAIIGASAILFGQNKVKVANNRLAIILNALWLMAAWVILQVMVGIALNGAAFLRGETGAVPVAVAAHIGSFIIGVLLANPLLLFKYRKA